MELAMANGFNEMSQNEMMEVDGGIDWDMVGGTIAIGGAAIGAYTPV